MGYYNTQRVNQLIRKIRALLNREFASRYPASTIHVSRGSADNIHILIVSGHFGGQSFTERDNMVWPILEAGLTPEEFVHISVCLLLTPNEVPVSLTGPGGR
jgi:stress-induced morphogen